MDPRDPRRRSHRLDGRRRADRGDRPRRPVRLHRRGPVAGLRRLSRRMPSRCSRRRVRPCMRNTSTPRPSSAFPPSCWGRESARSVAPVHGASPPTSSAGRNPHRCATRRRPRCCDRSAWTARSSSRRIRPGRFAANRCSPVIWCSDGRRCRTSGCWRWCFATGPIARDGKINCVAALRGALPPDWACVWLDFARTPPDDPEVAGREIARRIIARLGDDVVHVVWDGETAAEAAAVIARCDGCLAMRFHGALLAHVGGLPVVTLEYDDKVSPLSHELGVPARQRVALERIEPDLRPALEFVTGPERQLAFRLSRAGPRTPRRGSARAPRPAARGDRRCAPATRPGPADGARASAAVAVARAIGPGGRGARDAIARRFAAAGPSTGTERAAAGPRPRGR